MPRRILLAIDSLQHGGAERHVVDLAVALHRRGDDVEVACSADGPLAAELREHGVPVHVAMPRLVKRRTSLRYAWALRRLVRRTRPDVVHAHLYASAAAAAIATVGTDVPLVVCEQTEAPWRSRRARVMSRWVYRRARVVVAVSEAIRDLLEDGFGVLPAKVALVRNSVTPVPADAAARDGARPPTIGTIARLHPEKGLHHLLEAAPRIAAAVPGARFAVVGDGPLRAELEAAAREHGVADRVEFLGARDDARRLMAGFDLLVLPSISEGTPLTIVEAMLAGLPVVASAVGGIPEQVVDGVTGLLVPPRDPDALAAAATRVLSDPELARRLGEAGRARAEAEFSHATTIRRIDAVYARAVGASRTRVPADRWLRARSGTARSPSGS